MEENRNSCISDAVKGKVDNTTPSNSESNKRSLNEDDKQSNKKKAKIISKGT